MSLFSRRVLLSAAASLAIIVFFMVQGHRNDLPGVYWQADSTTIAKGAAPDTTAATLKDKRLIPKNQQLPFWYAIFGVLLYVMASAKNKRHRFDPAYIGDYFFRAAQAVTYLYIIMVIDAKQGGANFGDYSPNLIGLFTGMFIIHVERAIEGFGMLFGQVVGGILPKSLYRRTPAAREAERYHQSRRFEELRAQAAALKPILPASQSAALTERFDKVAQAVSDGDWGVVESENRELESALETLRQGVLEYQLSFGEIAEHDPDSA